MTLKSFSWTDSVSKHLSGLPVYRITKRAADRACLLPGPGATRTVGPYMSAQERSFLPKRFDRLGSDQNE